MSVQKRSTVARVTGNNGNHCQISHADKCRTDQTGKTGQYEYASSTDYIIHKYKQSNIEPAKLSKDFGASWWNGVSTRPDAVPQCRQCISDTNNFRDNFELFTSIVDFETIGSSMDEKGKEKDKLRMKCSHWCLWYEWFHERRINICKERIKKTNK